MRKTITAAMFFTGLAAAPASAACLYQGVYYEHGSTICFDGWFQECTVADYWSAIGICHASDVKQPIAQLLVPEEKTLVAMILGNKQQPTYSKPIGN
ncbi:MAG: hypothetical protein WBC93_12355 [Sulfitobacter sp.]